MKRKENQIKKGKGRGGERKTKTQKETEKEGRRGNILRARSGGFAQGDGFLPGWGMLAPYVQTDHRQLFPYTTPTIYNNHKKIPSSYIQKKRDQIVKTE